MKTKLYLTLIIFLSLSLLAACKGSPKNTATPVPTPFPTKLMQVVDVNGNSFPLFCEGEGEPTIVLKDANGMTGLGEGVVKGLSIISRTCRYNRAGLHPEAYQGWRTTVDQVKDLHEILTQAGVPRPYVLVGYDLGGLNVELYTYHYPEEVVGLVCMECWNQFFWLEMLEKIPLEQDNAPEKIEDSTYAPLETLNA